MSAPRHLSWENFRSGILLPGQQRVHRITDSPCIEVFGDGTINRLGILIEIASGTTIPPELSRLACITTRTLSQDGRFFIEVATTAVSLQRQFYHFSVAVAERVIVDECPAIEAIALELQCFTDLLGEKPLLGVEQQLGLLGELVFLERLIAKEGVAALDAWLGPLSEPHDFRVLAHEFEVKATVSPHRIHTIHGTEQLVASEGCSLYLVSVMLGPAGAGHGFSLAGKVTQLSDYFSTTPGRLAQFTAALEASGFHAQDSAQYTRQFAIRRPIGLVPVTNTFPAITRPGLQSVLGQLALRIESVQYDVNVEGLEREDGTVEFETTIPA